MIVPPMFALPRDLNVFLTSPLLPSMQALLNTWSLNTDTFSVANLLHIVRAVRGLAL